MDIFLEKLPFTLACTPDNPKQDMFYIRDPKDYPILYTAVTENVDIFITGDADFKDNVQPLFTKLLSPVLLYIAFFGIFTSFYIAFFGREYSLNQII